MLWITFLKIKVSSDKRQASERSERAKGQGTSERSERVMQPTSVASVAKMQHFFPYYTMYYSIEI